MGLKSDSLSDLHYSQRGRSRYATSQKRNAVDELTAIRPVASVSLLSIAINGILAVEVAAAWPMMVGNDEEEVLNYK